MRITQRERGDAAFDVGAITDAHDIQLFSKAGSYAIDGVRGKRSREAMQRGLLIALAPELHIPVGLFDLDAGWDGHGQLTFGPFHLQLFADLYLHPFLHRNRLVSNSPHTRK